MKNLLRCASILGFLLLLSSPGAQPQEQQKGQMRSALRILVFVRNADNSAASAGVMVRLEVDEGGLMDIQQTDSSGKVTFHPTVFTRYTLVIHQQGYADAVKRVDLSQTPSAAATLTLQPVPSQEGVTIPTGGAEGAVISSAQLAIPENARKEYEAGQRLLEEKSDASGSIGHFQKAIKIYDNFPQAYTMLGLAYLQDQKLTDSKAALERAVELDAKSGPALIALGGCLNQLKDYPASEKNLVKGLEILPESPEGNYALAKTYWAMHRWQDAEPHAIKAAKLQPDLPGVHVLLGNILLQKQDGAGAIKEFKEYLRLDPSGSMSEAVRNMVTKLEKAQGTH